MVYGQFGLNELLGAKVSSGEWERERGRAVGIRGAGRISGLLIRSHSSNIKSEVCRRMDYPCPGISAAIEWHKRPYRSRYDLNVCENRHCRLIPVFYPLPKVNVLIGGRLDKCGCGVTCPEVMDPDKADRFGRRTGVCPLREEAEVGTAGYAYVKECLQTEQQE